MGNCDYLQIIRGQLPTAFPLIFLSSNEILDQKDGLIVKS
jgi:hypothetical protein